MDSIKSSLAARAGAMKRNTRIHSAEHMLADEISTAFGERKRFAMYLGVIKRVGAGEARRVFSELQQEGKGHLGKLFMYLCSKAAKEKKRAAAPPTDRA